MHDASDFRNCGIAGFSLKDEATVRFWSNYYGCWK